MNTFLMAALMALTPASAFAEETITVAVIDTGLDLHHPAFKKALWVNRGETGVDLRGRDKSTNGIDDDGNGYIDDVNGWNFAGANPKLNDDHGHGTHIAGIITTKSTAIRLMTLKYYDPVGKPSEQIRNSVNAIDYAVKMGARIINYSGGGISPSFAEQQAILRAEAQGILFVAAAGNERSNSDLHPYFPADYGLSNIISVTALDPQQQLLPTSNYGIRSVDLAAPGENILSTLPSGLYGRMSGTSQATAFVTGMAGWLMSQDKNLRTPAQVLQKLVQDGQPQANLQGKTRYGVRLRTETSPLAAN